MTAAALGCGLSTGGTAGPTVDLTPDGRVDVWVPIDAVVEGGDPRDASDGLGPDAPDPDVVGPDGSSDGPAEGGADGPDGDDCPWPKRVCGTTCVDVETDPDNCGVCGRKCLVGWSCSGAVCCTTGWRGCGGGCVYPLTDPSHCGDCGIKCAAGASCLSGKCTCPGASTLCADRCVYLLSDPDNCGACGKKCSSPPTCIAGACK